MKELTRFNLRIERIGNEANPKLIILLENPGSDAEFIKRAPEYTMKRDGVYKASEGEFKIEREYCEWWDKLLKITDLKIKDTEILALEYYPYATSKDKKTKKEEIYGTKKKPAIWDDCAEQSLKKNIELLSKFMKQNLPIFVYYNSGWFSKDLKDLKDLKLSDYKNISKGSDGFPNQILKRLKTFISKTKINPSV